MAEGLSNLTKKLVSRKHQRDLVRSLHVLQKNEKLPKEVFSEVLKTIPTVALEVVPIYEDENGELKVFLTKRSSDDKFWPNMWHSPGTMVINIDANGTGNFGHAWDRLKKNEFMDEGLGDPVAVSQKLLKTKRGNEVSLIHYINVPNDLKGGEYFSIDNLPDNLVNHHLIIIGEALDAYKKNEK
jgi:hypothetical protein